MRLSFVKKMAESLVKYGSVDMTDEDFRKFKTEIADLVAKTEKGEPDKDFTAGFPKPGG